MYTLSTPLSTIASIKKPILPKLAKLSVKSVEDLLRHTPARYDDFSKMTAIADMLPGNIYTLEGIITSFVSKRSWRKRLPVTEVVIEDSTGSIKAIWYNQRFLADTLREGAHLRLSGKVVLSKNNALVFQSPSFELASRSPNHTGRLVPTYPETFGITSKWIRWQIQSLLRANIKIDDPIPQHILDTFHLPDLRHTFLYVHFPETENHWKIALKRFAFEEMFLFQLRSLRARRSFEQHSAKSLKSDTERMLAFIRSLPFELTSDQTKALSAISRDMETPRPMNRLLNGDVGSGKTVVALCSMLSAAHAQHQSALLVPTEVLALQHFRSFCTLLEKETVTIALLTSSYQYVSEKGSASRKVSRPKLLDYIEKGTVDILIGTHALLQKDIRFHALALIVVDEQHRFGVRQRAFLQQKSSELHDGIRNAIPHLLTMTATPIPRTLAIAFFGNLDISLLETLPKGRKTIVTKHVPPGDRQLVYEFIRSELRKGQQTYVILPLVSESEKLKEVKAAIQECDRLEKEVFPEFHVGLLHGKMKSIEKEDIMQKFKENTIHVLVATSVVEVGVDVPNATVMIVEDADRFGLSQLHQFRGRVGRSELQSYCFLFSETDSSVSRDRLSILEKFSSGFHVAEKDLEQRGPGEFFGTHQSGLSDISMENMANIRLITLARQEAETLLKEDPKLSKYKNLQQSLAQFQENLHLE